MNKTGARIVSLSISILVLLGIIVFNGSNNEKPDSETSMAERVQKSVQATEQNRAEVDENAQLSQINSNGAVAVKVTLLPSESKKNELIVFEVAMNTHSVELNQYDITKQVELFNGSDQPVEGEFEWESVNNDSHHVKGFLKWKSEVADISKSIKLNIKDIDGIDSRIYSWKL